MARNKNLKLFRPIIFYEAGKLFFLKCFVYKSILYQNKKVTAIELRNENEQNVISYSQLKQEIFSNNLTPWVT